MMLAMLFKDKYSCAFNVHGGLFYSPTEWHTQAWEQNKGFNCMCELFITYMKFLH